MSARRGTLGKRRKQARKVKGLMSNYIYSLEPDWTDHATGELYHRRDEAEARRWAWQAYEAIQELVRMEQRELRAADRAAYLAARKDR